MLENYIDYVMERIKKVEASCSLIADNQIHPFRLHRELAEYIPNQMALIAEYQRVKTEDTKLNLRYQKFWDEAFITSRNKLNIDRTKTKYASKGEIESQTRVDYADEYADWQERLLESEMKVRFMLRLLEAWKKQDQILIEISRNMKSELESLTIMDRGVPKTGHKKLRVPKKV